MSVDPEGELAALLPRLIRDSRVHFIDNLRSTLVALVIFHHACLPFGGFGMWPYVSPYHSTASSRILSLFVTVNQSYFMGLLFFLSGHWSSLAADRKNWAAFCVDKLKRLAVPAPLVFIVVWWKQQSPIFSPLLAYWTNLRGVQGPSVLLLFDLIYITIRTFLPPFYLPATAAVSISAVIICSYLIRTSHPGGVVTPPLNIQLAQYLLVPSHPGRALALAYFFAIISLFVISFPLKFGMTWLVDALSAVWNEVILIDVGGPGPVYGVIKALVVGTLGVCISWAAAWILIRLPGVGKFV
ncbi:hypothetical protein B0H14DRAFT_2717298 [Mycena olivaceomarginata]|nr:hypothetical protein B0H14DRAFT_2717298 [Mycena olivaceomarginata]